MAAVFFPHRAGLILINIPILVGIHLVKHHFSVAGMLFPAYPAIIIGVRHGHPTAAFSILLVTTVGVLLVTISILPVAISAPRVTISAFVIIVAARYHEAFLKGLYGE